ncbi:hypothetical protein [Streptomyces sp. NRRL F-3218]|uniref:hypothetical protein n=1 Tax=Streptomyces sp. NRRL F-3218 TaxID=1463847 RepID=UPI00067B1B9D|nr:hypothetical protein [Streptomyces sp. NRRL F-3218]
MAAVLAGEGRHDVDVVVGVTDRHPPAGVGVAVRGDAGGVDHLGGDGRPLGVRQGPVGGFVTDGDVPHVLGRFRAAQRLDRGVQEQREVGERHAVRVAGRAGQARGPSGDEVRVDVLLVVPGAEEVGQEIGGGVALGGLLRHHGPYAFLMCVSAVRA